MTSTIFHVPDCNVSLARVVLTLKSGAISLSNTATESASLWQTLHREQNYELMQSVMESKRIEIQDCCS